jgi:regulator of replication initiation timing
MASLGVHQEPPIVFDLLNNFFNFGWHVCKVFYCSDGARDSTCFKTSRCSLGVNLLYMC